MSVSNLRSMIDRYLVRYPEERSVGHKFLELLTDYPDCFERNCEFGHITGSAWLVDPDEKVLLTHHKKLKKWLQLGGHSDGVKDVLAVATREAMEESGLEVVALDTEIFDIDVHKIPERFISCSLSLRRPLYVPLEEQDFSVSEESIDLEWVPIGDVHLRSTDDSVLRLKEQMAEALLRLNFVAYLTKKYIGNLC